MKRQLIIALMTILVPAASVSGDMVLGDIQFVRIGGSNVIISEVEYTWDVENWLPYKHEMSWGNFDAWRCRYNHQSFFRNIAGI